MNIGLMKGNDQCLDVERWFTRYKSAAEDKYVFTEGRLSINDARIYDNYVESDEQCSTYYNDELVESVFV